MSSKVQSLTENCPVGFIAYSIVLELMTLSFGAEHGHVSSTFMSIFFLFLTRVVFNNLLSTHSKFSRWLISITALAQIFSAFEWKHQCLQRVLIPLYTSKNHFFVYNSGKLSWRGLSVVGGIWWRLEAKPGTEEDLCRDAVGFSHCQHHVISSKRGCFVFSFCFYTVQFSKSTVSIFASTLKMFTHTATQWPLSRPCPLGH